MIQTYGKSGRPVAVDGDPEAGELDGLADADAEGVGADVVGGDADGDVAAVADGEPEPGPHPIRDSATSHAMNGSGALRGPRTANVPPFAAYPLRPPPNNVPNTPRMMS